MTRIDFHGDPWAGHSQEPWKDDAANPRFPLPLRVAFLAYGNHQANGHANFKQGEVAKALAKLVDGELVIPDRRTVWRAIRQAVDYRLLAPESKALCLVVAEHRVQGGVGDENAPCKRHDSPRKRARHLRSVS